MSCSLQSSFKFRAFTLIELLVIVVMTAFIIQGVHSGGIVLGGRFGGLVGGVLGFVAFVLSMILVGLIYGLTVEGIPHRPRCRTGRCRAGDYELKAEEGEPFLVCQCGDRYRRHERHFYRVVDRDEVPYLRWRAFRGWRVDPLEGERINLMSFDALSHFLACYFNQDFALDGTPDEVIRRYIEQYTDQPQLSSTVEDLRHLLRMGQDDATLKRILFALGSYYDPTADGWTCSAWLNHVETMLAAGAGETNAS